MNEWSNYPVIVGVRGNLGPLVRIHAKVEHRRSPHTDEGFPPDRQGTFLALLAKYGLPVLIARGDELTVVIEIKKLGASGFVLLAGQVSQLVVAVEVYLEGLATEVRTA